MSSFNTFLNDKGETAESIKEPSFVSDDSERTTLTCTTLICPHCDEAEQFIIYLTQEYEGYIGINGTRRFSHEIDPSEINWDGYVEIDVTAYKYPDDDDWQVSAYSDPEIEDWTDSDYCVECQSCGSTFDSYSLNQEFGIDLSVY